MHLLRETFQKSCLFREMGLERLIEFDLVQKSNTIKGSILLNKVPNLIEPNRSIKYNNKY